MVINIKEHIILIISYCDTQEKLDIITDLINYYKSNHSDIDIMIYAHYPLPFDIQKMVKFYIYDSTNPVLKENYKYIIVWNDVTEFLKYPSHAVQIIPDTGWAILSMWDKSLKYLKIHKYKYAHIVNYDINMLHEKYDSILKENIKKLSEGIEISPAQHKLENGGIYSDLAHTSISIDAYINKMSDIITIDDYLKDVSIGVEEYLTEVIKKSNIICKGHSVYVDSFCDAQSYNKRKVTYLNIWCSKDINNRIILILYHQKRELIKTLTIEVNSTLTKYKFVPDNPNVYMVIDLTSFNPEYLKIIEVNEIIEDYTVISKIDSEYLRKHYIEKL